MPVIDASVWVALFHQSDIHHGKARACLRRLAESGELCHMPEIVFPEVSGALSRATGSPALARQACAKLRAFPHRSHEIDQRLGQKASDLAAKLSLRGMDAVYVALAQELGAALVTFDQEQLTRTKDEIEARIP